MRRGWSNSAQRAICKGARRPDPVRVAATASQVRDAKTHVLVAVGGHDVRVVAEEAVEVHVQVLGLLCQLLGDAVDLEERPRWSVDCAAGIKQGGAD